MSNTDQKTNKDLLSLILEQEIDLFHCPKREAYIRVSRGNRWDIWPVKSNDFKEWATYLYYKSLGKSVGGQVLTDLSNLLTAKARHDGDEKQVFLRLADYEGKIYFDLADINHNVVEVSANDGWKIISNKQSPVYFCRRRGMKPLPIPEKGGDVKDLFDFINITRKDFDLLLSWIIATALCCPGPYPVLILQGEQGTAKTTTTRIIRELVDPSVTPIRSLPRDVHELFIATQNSRMIAFDNLSGLPGWTSDVLCQLATGGGFAKRALYSDTEEILYQAQTPLILNGIDDIATRPDLIDRALVIELPQITEDKRLDEKSFWNAFEIKQPQILGSLLTALSGMLKEVPNVVLDAKPRMADFAKRGVAIEKALHWTDGSFLDSYNRQRKEALVSGLEASPVTQPFIRFMECRREWRGTMTELLSALIKLIDSSSHESRKWPTNAKALGNQLRRLLPALRVVGYSITRERSSKSRTVILVNHNLE